MLQILTGTIAVFSLCSQGGVQKNVLEWGVSLYNHQVKEIDFVLQILACGSNVAISDTNLGLLLTYWLIFFLFNYILLKFEVSIGHPTYLQPSRATLILVPKKISLTYLPYMVLYLTWSLPVQDNIEILAQFHFSHFLKL